MVSLATLLAVSPPPASRPYTDYSHPSVGHVKLASDERADKTTAEVTADLCAAINACRECSGLVTATPYRVLLPDTPFVREMMRLAFMS